MEFENLLELILRNTEFARTGLSVLPIPLEHPCILITCMDARFDIGIFGLSQRYDIVTGGGNIFSNIESIKLAFDLAKGFCIVMLHHDCRAMQHLLKNIDNPPPEFKEWAAFLHGKDICDNRDALNLHAITKKLLDFQINHLLTLSSLLNLVGLIHDTDGSMSGSAGKVLLYRINNSSGELLRSCLSESALINMRDHLLI